jgi:hypothetical protein
MTNTNPRDLILKLTDLAEGVISKYLDVVGADPDALLISDLIAEARAYLTQPEPKVPTDEEPLELLPEAVRNEFASL